MSLRIWITTVSDEAPGMPHSAARRPHKQPGLHMHWKSPDLAVAAQAQLLRRWVGEAGEPWEALAKPHPPLSPCPRLLGHL